MPALKHPHCLLAAAIGLVFVLTLACSGLLSPRPAPRYTVTDLGVLPGGSSSGASAINNQGIAAGFTQTGDHPGIVRQHACVFESGKIIDLGVPPGTTDSRAVGINARGEVTGSIGQQVPRRPFLYSGGRMCALGTLPGFSDSTGTAINDRGEVVGSVTTSGFGQQRAFLYSHGRMTDLGMLPGASRTEADAINSTGQVVGECYARSHRVRFAPFLYDSRRKTMTALPVPPPYIFGHASAVNDHGQVVGGVSARGIDNQAALWNSGHLTLLGVPPGFDEARATGINNRGEIVGRCFRDLTNFQWFLVRNAGSNNPWQRYLDRDDDRAVVYRDGKMQDLNDLIPSSAGWTLEGAEGINDRGQIVGSGLHHGKERAFLLTPR